MHEGYDAWKKKQMVLTPNEMSTIHQLKPVTETTGPPSLQSTTGETSSSHSKHTSSWNACQPA
eukprot:898312-Amphidinium_carterae.1